MQGFNDGVLTSLAHPILTYGDRIIHNIALKNQKYWRPACSVLSYLFVCAGFIINCSTIVSSRRKFVSTK